jgi:hypothetical protein
MNEINIAQDFSKAPGGRFREDGKASGQEFRERFLEPLFAEGATQDSIRILLDGSYGYPTSFLEEAFGGLARRFGSAKVMSRLEFVSVEEPLLIDEIKSYILNAEDK